MPLSNHNKINPGPIAHHAIVVHTNFAYLVGGVKPDGSNNTELYRYSINGCLWEI